MYAHHRWPSVICIGLGVARQLLVCIGDTVSRICPSSGRRPGCRGVAAPIASRVYCLRSRVTLTMITRSTLSNTPRMCRYTSQVCANQFALNHHSRRLCWILKHRGGVSAICVPATAHIPFTAEIMSFRRRAARQNSLVSLGSGSFVGLSNCRDLYAAPYTTERKGFPLTVLVGHAMCARRPLSRTATFPKIR